MSNFAYEVVEIYGPTEDLEGQCLWGYAVWCDAGNFVSGLIKDKDEAYELCKKSPVSDEPDLGEILSTLHDHGADAALAKAKLKLDSGIGPHNAFMGGYQAAIDDVITAMDLKS